MQPSTNWHVVLDAEWVTAINFHNLEIYHDTKYLKHLSDNQKFMGNPASYILNLA